VSKGGNERNDPHLNNRSHSGLSFRTGTSLNGGVNVKSTLLGNLSEAKPLKVSHAMTKEEKEVTKLQRILELQQLNADARS
jgi:hypothetical protein